MDAIAVAANDPFKLLPVLNEAREQGIKVITWDSDTDPTGRDLFVNTVDPQTLGIHLMDDLAARLNEKKGNLQLLQTIYPQQIQTNGLSG
ncbi:hypothetical protein GCM10020331_009300 [Ectobacillus funiculus]